MPKHSTDCYRHKRGKIAPGVTVRIKSRTKRKPVVQVLNAFGKTRLEEKIAAELRRQVLARGRGAHR